MAKEAYSKENYIIDQRATADIPYGRGASDESGCGWIALYNLMRCLGTPISEAEAQALLLRASLFGGRLGTSPLHVCRALRHYGLHYCIKWRKKRLPEQLAGVTCGILLYRHKTGLHYVAFRREDARQFQFWNAVLAKERHVAGMRQFLDHYTVGSLVMCIMLQTGIVSQEVCL